MLKLIQIIVLWKLLLISFCHLILNDLINNKPLRNKFINFDGKKQIIIRKYIIPELINSKDLEEIMKVFIDEINKNIGSDFIPNMIPKIY